MERRRWGAIASVTVILGLGLTAALVIRASRADRAQLQAGGTTLAPATQPSSTSFGVRKRVTVKFREGTGVRLRDARFATIAQADLGPLDTVLERYPGTTIQRVFDRPEETLTREQADLAARSGRPQADKNLYYYLDLVEGLDPAALVTDLGRLAIVEAAYPAQEANRLP